MSDFLPYVIIGLTAGSVYGLAGTGLVLTFKTSGIFNFAHGTTGALVAYAFYDLRVRNGVPWPIAFAICLLVLCPILGLLLERMARRLADAPVAMKVVATVGLLIGIQQLIIVRYGPAVLFMDHYLPEDNVRIFDVNVAYHQIIVMFIALLCVLGLTFLFAKTRSGRMMRAVVDQPELLAMTGTSPVKVRRQAWMIGSMFAGLSGMLLAPELGLEPIVLTLLVVQAFGAAALGMFTSIPMTYVGGLALGVAAAVTSKYVATIDWLSGVPASLPFIVLFLVLVFAPKRWLVDFTVEKKMRVVESKAIPPAGKAIIAVGLVLLCWRLPDIAGARLPVYTAALPYVIIFLSLALLMRTSGQVSLAQLAFASVGSAASARLAVEAGLPWLAAVLLGALFAVPVGALLAIPAIRRSGLYLSLATFGFAVLMERLISGTSLMFGGGAISLPAPRPSFADGDEAYFYLLLVFVVACVALIALLRRSRLGRLLRAMSDSTVALNTYGTSVMGIKVIVFCVSAFIAGLGGALLGPVTGSASPGDFNSIAGLLLVVLSVLVPGTEIMASIGAAISLYIIPSYINNADINQYLPFVFGIFALAVAMTHAGMQAPGWMVRASARARRRPDRSPAKARLAAQPQPEPTVA